jgi:hypothetical protein
MTSGIKIDYGITFYCDGVINAYDVEFARTSTFSGGANGITEGGIVLGAPTAIVAESFPLVYAASATLNGRIVTVTFGNTPPAGPLSGSLSMVY